MNYEDIKQIPVTDVVFRDDLYLEAVRAHKTSVS